MKSALLFFACFFITQALTDSPILLHIVPHSHEDLGWLYTVKSYFLGTNPRGCVECILDNVTLALSQDPNRKFSYVEMGYFKIWWSRQNETSQERFRQLHANGQFEFLNAGIVMNDEGAAYYDDIIEQMSKGLRFVKDTFNFTVQTAWHIDPFGHSAAQASLFSQMGFNSWFFERIDYEDFDNRVAHRAMETIWKPKTFSELNYLLAHVDYMSYYLAPFNWCIDMICFPSNTPFDSMQRIFKYSTWVQNQTNFYLTNHVQHHIGGDFEWHNDTEYLYKGLEVIIDFFNAHEEFGITPFFSTPSNYTDSVYQEFLDHKTAPLSVKEDDFLSYVDEPHAYWTGYYSSRAVFKREIRAAGQRLQTVRKLLSKMMLERPEYWQQTYGDFEASLDQYEEVNGILQHHDSITGTAKQNVTYNYENMLTCATEDINKVMNSIVTNYTKSSVGENLVHYECSVGSSKCDNVFKTLAELTSALLTIYNPSSQTSNLIRITVPRLSLKVIDQNNTQLNSDVICDDYSDPLACSLYFYTEIPTNSFASYKISLGDVTNSNIVPAAEINQDIKFVIKDIYMLQVYANLTDFVYIVNRSGQWIESPFTVNYKYYQSYYEENEQASGAYIFRPAQNYSLPYSQVLSGRCFVGTAVNLIQIKGNTTVASIIMETSPRYDTPVIQINTLTLPVDISDGIGKELTINIAGSGIDNSQMFYTDSNGLEMQERILNYRETYTVNITEPVAGNYFPVYSAIYIEDTDSQQRMTIVTDRSEGGSSLNKGEIELMIHRRILHDDNRGVGEALNETDSKGVGIQVKVSHYLFFSQGDSDTTQRQVQYDLDTQKLIFAAVSDIETFKKPVERAVEESLPSLVKFYVRPYSDTNFLVRLHNLNERENATVNLIDSQNKPLVMSHLIGDDYVNLTLVSIEELALGANQNKQDMLNGKYRWTDDFSPITVDDNLNTVVLRPLEMRVFNMEIDVAGVWIEKTGQVGDDTCDCVFSVGPDEVVTDKSEDEEESRLQYMREEFMRFENVIS